MESKTINFKEQDVNWIELEKYGIRKDELIQKGQLDKLLAGEKSDILSLDITILGVELKVDGTIQMEWEDDHVTVNIDGLQNNK